MMTSTFHGGNPTLCSMLLGTYYAQNYASIIGGSLPVHYPGVMRQHQQIFWDRTSYSQEAVSCLTGEGTVWRETLVLLKFGEFGE